MNNNPLQRPNRQIVDKDEAIIKVKLSQQIAEENTKQLINKRKLIKQANNLLDRAEVLLNKMINLIKNKE